jgi:hypothetical protein
MTWHSYTPEGCPPTAAVGMDGCFYRLVASDPPTQTDFKSHKELNPSKPFPDPCQACGLSIFQNLNDIVALKARVPAFKKKFVAIGELQSHQGVLCHTPSSGQNNSHHTWWLPTEIDCTGWFKVLTP